MELSAVGERVFAAESIIKRRIRKVSAQRAEAGWAHCEYGVFHLFPCLAPKCVARAQAPAAAPWRGPALHPAHILALLCAHRCCMYVTSLSSTRILRHEELCDILRVMWERAFISLIAYKWLDESSYLGSLCNLKCPYHCSPMLSMACVINGSTPAIAAIMGCHCCWSLVLLIVLIICLLHGNLRL